MDAQALLDRLHQQAPFALMVRGAIDWFFEPEFLNTLAEQAYQTNYTRDIHFADLVELLLPVVFQPDRTVRSSFRGNPRLATVATLTSFYGKLNGVDPEVSRALVGRTAQRATTVLAEQPPLAATPLPGYRLLTRDGNHLAATERRLDGLTACTALPGLGLILREFTTGLFLDLLPIPDAYAREVSHAPAVLGGTLRAGDCVVADREFCAAGVFAAVEHARAFFVIRHRKSVQVHAQTPLRACHTSAQRTVREQVVRYSNGERAYRAVRVELARPTQDGDTVITVLTNLPAHVGAETVADVYHGRRSIETAFHELAMALQGEVRTLAVPRAALLCFAVAAAVYNLLQVVRHAVAWEQGVAVAENLSTQLLCQEVRWHLASLLVIYDAGELGPRGDWTAAAVRGWLGEQAKRIDAMRYERSRGRKPGSVSGKRGRSPRLHESTQQHLDNRSAKRTRTP